MGHKLMPVLKIKRVTDQARFIPAYHNCITNLQDNGQARDYKAVCVGLFKWQVDMSIKSSNRSDSGKKKTTQALEASSQVMNQTTDCMAKPDPDQQQRCYYCHGENHNSQFCCKNPNSQLQMSNCTNSSCCCQWQADVQLRCLVSCHFCLLAIFRSAMQYMDCRLGCHWPHYKWQSVAHFLHSVYTGFEKTAGGRMICIVAKGEVAINLNACEVHLDNGLYLPDASRNLVSVWALANVSVCCQRSHTQNLISVIETHLLWFLLRYVVTCGVLQFLLRYVGEKPLWLFLPKDVVVCLLLQVSTDHCRHSVQR